MPEFRMQRSFKMAFSSSLTLVQWNICYANNERKPTGSVNRNGTGKSKRKEILKKIQFTSFSKRLRLMSAWKFMKINSYNIRQILQPSLYGQKRWCQHLFFRGCWNWQLTSSSSSGTPFQVPPCPFWDAEIRRKNWLCSCPPKIHGQGSTIYCSLR